MLGAVIVKEHWPEALISFSIEFDEASTPNAWQEISLRGVTETLQDVPEGCPGPFTHLCRAVIDDEMTVSGVFVTVSKMIQYALDHKMKPRVTSGVVRLLLERVERDKTRE